MDAAPQHGWIERFIRLGVSLLLLFGVMAIVLLKAKAIPQRASLVAIGSIVLVVVMMPFAQTQLLRLIYNALLGAGPLTIGFVLWRGGQVKLVAGKE